MRWGSLLRLCRCADCVPFPVGRRDCGSTRDKVGLGSLCGCCNPVAGGDAGSGGGSGALAIGPSSPPADTAAPDNSTVKDTAKAKRWRILAGAAVLGRAAEEAETLADIFTLPGVVPRFWPSSGFGDNRVRPRDFVGPWRDG